LSIGNCHIVFSRGFDAVHLAVMPKRTTPPKPQPQKPERSHVTSGINLPVEIYQLLNRVAFSRSLKNGGRPSVSALLIDLVQRHRKELEKELDE
jgi:hypothetical protein